MKTRWHSIFLLSLGLLSLFTLPVIAQENELETYLGRLPEHTLFYVSWKNVDKFEQLRATNPVLRLLDSPEMKANWQALDEFYAQQEKSRQSPRKPTEEKGPSPAEPDWHELATLLANPGFLALVSPPPAAEAHSATPESALLLLYDTTGKEEFIENFLARQRKPGSTERQYEFEGVTVVETIDAGGKQKAYKARIGRWLVGGDNQAAVEAWIRALRQAPERSLKDTAQYQRTQAYRDPHAQLEFFLNLAAVSDLLGQYPAGARGGVSPKQVGEALGLKDWDLVVAGLTFEPERLRYQLTVLRNAAAAGASPLTILAPSVSDFSSLNLAPENTLSYSVSEVSLPATWAYLRRAMSILVPPEQARVVEGFQAMTETVLGVKMDELTAAWGTEFAQMSYPAAEDGKIHTLYALSVRNRETVLTSLRNLAPLVGPQVNVEEMAAPSGQPNVIYFQLSRAPSGEQSQSQSFLLAALTADWLLVSSRQDEVERAVGRLGQGPSLRDNPTFQKSRARFPAALTTFSFADADRWLESGAVAGFLREVAKNMAEAAHHKKETSAAEPAKPETPPEAGSTPSTPAPEPPEFKIPRGYVKWILSGTTRDAQGIYHTGIIE